MADVKIEGCSAASSDPVEKEFRKKNLWYSFTSAFYGAFGGAAFFGLLATVVGTLVKVAAGGAPAAEAALLFGATPVLVMAGLMAVGTLCVYMSQRESTELRCIQDEHLAYQNAKKLAKQPAPQQEQGLEQAPVGRKDGKSWEQVTRASTLTAPRVIH